MAVGKVLYNIVLNNEKNSERLVHIPPKGWGVRHLQTFLLFLCVVMGYALRSQLSVLMVAMINTCDRDNSNYTRIEIPANGINFTYNNEECRNVQNISDWSVYRTYDWNKATQEIVTFSFFVGYTSMQLPMGLLAQKLGGKIPIIIGLAVNGILTFCTPWIFLVGGWIWASVSRMLQGMTQAALDPSVLTMLTKWTPTSERGRMTTYAFSGCPMGTVIAFQLSGLLAGNPALGWPASFWFFGIVTLLVCGLFGWLGAASPDKHSRMTTEELVYILEDDSIKPAPKKYNTPWKEILKCPSVWGIIISQAGCGAYILLIMTEIPLYLTNVLGVDTRRNGLYSSLPFIAMYFSSISLGYLADYARNRHIMKVVNIRRLANTIGSVVSGIFLLAFSFVNNTLLAVCLLILSLGTASGVQVGFVVNQIDLAPNFAGSIMALGNMGGYLTSLLVPVVVSNIVTDVRNQEQWRIVFVIFIGFFFICNAIFVIFAKAEVQPWNFYGEDEYEPEEKTQTLIDEKKEINGKGKNLVKENI